MTASSASSCLWMAHPELDKRQRRERRASWAHSLVACTYVRAPGEKTEQEFEERYALIARPWLTPVNWQELRNEFLALRCTTEEVAHQQKHLNVLTERQQWGYSTFHQLFLSLLSQQQQSSNSWNERYPAAVWPEIYKHEVNKMQRQNILP